MKVLHACFGIVLFSIASGASDLRLIEAVERALEAEKSCAEIMHLVAAARGAMNGFMAEIVEDHIRFHVSDPANDPDRERAKGSEELIEVVRAYLR